MKFFYAIFFRFCLVLFFMSTAMPSLWAQIAKKGSVSGMLVDSASNAPLQFASVAVISTSDSTRLAGAFTKEDGRFSLADIPVGRHLLRITFQGYQKLDTLFTITEKALSFNADNLLLTTAPNVLEEVIVRSTPPISVKGDTTEFNATSFQTQPNATAEDLVKKLPGMEVDKEGAVKAQGEPVTKIYVDGKPFFGKDPALAMRNLPVDVIEKVQIIDAMSDQSAFTGFDDGIQEKVINIITKKDRRKGYFGKANASIGNDGRYGSSLNLNRFNGDRKLSLVGRANNTSQENLSIQQLLDVVNAGGFGRNGFGDFDNAQGGIARTYAGGINYNDVLNAKTQVNGSYHYENSNNINQQKSLRETFVNGDSSLFNNNLRYRNNRNISHRLNFELDHKFDSSNSILIKPNYTAQTSNNFSESNSYLTRGKSAVEKDVRTVNNSLTNSRNFNNQVLFRHKFSKRGRTLSINLDQSYNTSETDRTTLNYINNYSNGTPRSDTANRISNTVRDSKRNSINFSYTEPAGSKGQVELKYNYTKGYTNSNQNTFLYNLESKQYSIRDSVQSNQFKNSNTSKRAGIIYRMQINKQWNYNVGLAVQQVDLVSDNLSKNKLINQSFTNYIPSAFLQYRKDRGNHFRLSYYGNNRMPDINQLQDLVNNNNLLNISRGNPALKQEFSNNINLRYTQVNRATSSNFIVRLNASFIQNKISDAVTVNSSQNNIVVDDIVLQPLARYSKPVNVGGVYNLNGYINFGFPLKKKGANLNLATNLSHNRNVNLINDVKGFTSNYSVGEKISLTLSLQDHFDMNFASNSTYNIARYSLKPGQNGNYYTQTFSVEPKYYTKSGWIVESDFDYTMTKGYAAGYNQSLPLWNASLAKQVLGKKQGEIKLSVFDILNQNNSFSRTIEQNYIEDVQSTVLRRYFLLTFSYNLRQFGGRSNSRRDR